MRLRSPKISRGRGLSLPSPLPLFFFPSFFFFFWGRGKIRRKYSNASRFHPTRPREGRHDNAARVRREPLLLLFFALSSLLFPPFPFFFKPEVEQEVDCVPSHQSAAGAGLFFRRRPWRPTSQRGFSPPPPFFLTPPFPPSFFFPGLRKYSSQAIRAGARRGRFSENSFALGGPHEPAFLFIPSSPPPPPPLSLLPRERACRVYLSFSSPSPPSLFLFFLRRDKL